MKRNASSAEMSQTWNQSDKATRPAMVYQDRAFTPRQHPVPLSDMMIYIRRESRAIVAIMLLAGAVALVATWLIAPDYRSSATIEVTQGTVSEAQESPTSPVGTESEKRFLQTQAEILRSRTLAAQVADDLEMVKSDAALAALAGGRVSPSDSDEHRLNRLMEALQQRLSVVTSDKSRLITVSFDSHDAKLSRAITKAYVAAFIIGNLQRQSRSSQYAQQFLATQLQETRQELATAERALNQYARDNDLVRAGGTAMGEEGAAEQSLLGAALQQINTALGEAKAARIEAQSRWQAVNDSDPLSSPEVLSNPAMQQLLSREADVDAQLQKLETVYLPDHPDILRLQGERKALSAQIARLGATISASIGESYQAALARENALLVQLRNLRGESLDENDASVAYNILAREAAAKRSQYRGLLERFNALNASSGSAAGNIAVVDEASLPLAPISPRLSINLAIALLAGLSIAVVWTVWRAQGDQSLRSPADIARLVPLPILGVIPANDPQLPLHKQLSNSKSALSEAYDALRTALFHSLPDGLPPVLFVTSSQAGEGKSLTSYAMARALARLGVNTLLIDTDMRRPVVHHWFGDSNDRGLATALAEGSDPFALVRASSNANLSYLAAGPVPPHPSDLLGGPGFSQMLDRARLLYECVIIDGPPIVGLADAAIIASLADGTALVVEANRTGHSAVDDAIERLTHSDGMLLGVILTKFLPQSAGRNYVYRDADYLRYGVGTRAFELAPAMRI
ncbi:polysaccharide biosynthesis tyrosine autokinase [Altererythrobacter indicus]|uniref:Polysaccharide biosynthesis tyrosine autokinase n=1 Tax=Altericroceibacterium indicum TaxID=374177 RepID=A0A845A8C0_9SPHN|nr:polysaccharide biosynthesis tyrosine autokinase [Altericroceibacterium indicum]MXP26622.1 polysaccharide biosynthesis tyrosine autokinase [Altericroceibacterium indicum]